MSQVSLWLEATDRIRGMRRGLRWLILASFVGPLVFIVSAAFAIFGLDMDEGGAALIVSLTLTGGPALALIGVRTLVRSEDGRLMPGGAGIRFAGGVSIAYSVCFALGVWALAISVIANERPSISFLSAALSGAGVLWCVRNILLLIRFRRTASIANMRRIAGVATIMRVWSGLIAAGATIVGTTLFVEGVSSIPDNKLLRVILALGFYAWVGITLIWLAVWPVFLARLDFGLRRVVRDHEKLGQPAIRETSVDPPVRDLGVTS